MRRQRIQRQDILAAARQTGIERQSEMQYVIVERNGSISVVGRD